MLFTLPHCLTKLSLYDLQVAVSQAEEKRNRGRKREEGAQHATKKKKTYMDIPKWQFHMLKGLKKDVDKYCHVLLCFVMCCI